MLTSLQSTNQSTFEIFQMEPISSLSEDPQTSSTQPVESPTDNPELQTTSDKPDEQVQITFTTVQLDNDEEITQSNEHIPEQPKKHWGAVWIVLTR